MQPHRIKVGSSVILVSLDGLAADWGIEEKHILRMLHQFGGIPLVTPMEGGKQYVNLYSLETALFEAGLPVAFKGDQTLVRTHQELCGVMYGTLSKEVIRERCKLLAAALRRPSAATNKDPTKRGLRKTRSR